MHQQVGKFARHFLWVKVLYGAARRFAQQEQRTFCSQVDRCAHELGFIGKSHRSAMLAMAQVFARSPVVEGNGGKSGSHGLQRDVAECFRQAREQEQIGACIVTRELIAALYTGKDGVGIGRLQFGAQGTIADENKTRTWLFCLQLTKRE